VVAEQQAKIFESFIQGGEMTRRSGEARTASFSSSSPVVKRIGVEGSAAFAFMKVSSPLL